MFAPGDIVEIYSPVAGYPKYHVCILDCDGAATALFLYINSGTGFAGDLVCDDSEFGCLPKSPTGQSVISCSQLVRMSAHQLSIFKAKKLGKLPPAVARKLEKFVVTAFSLRKSERQLVLNAMANVN